jgi:hypothetical protein
VSEFAAPKYQKILSYTTGWLCAVGWQVFLASVAFMVGGIIQGLIALNDDTYSFQAWHVTLLTIGIMAAFRRGLHLDLTLGRILCSVHPNVGPLASRESI